MTAIPFSYLIPTILGVTFCVKMDYNYSVTKSEVNMELILISNSKLKIMLSAEDMKLYNIECDGESALHRGFKPVLDAARRDCGFDTESGRLLVQVFPSRGGGCEMFVTRVALGSGKDGKDENKPSVCIFKTAGDLASVCRILNLRGYGRDSSAYALEEGVFALFLPEFDPDERLPLGAAVIEEFGQRRDLENLEEYIKEHARTIFLSDAVALLSEFS